MNRIALIAVALCFLVLTSVGAGLVVAKPQANVPQAGKSSIYLFDVTYDGAVVGKLVIDHKHDMFVFNGEGLTPDIYYTLLFVHTIGTARADIIGSEQTTEDGTVHIKDVCDISTTLLAENWPFTLLPTLARGDCDPNCTLSVEGDPVCQYVCPP